MSLSEPVDASLINDNGAMSSMQEDSLTSNENGSTDSVYSYENRVAMELVSSPACVPFAKVSVPSGEWRDEPFSLQITPCTTIYGCVRVHKRFNNLLNMNAYRNM